MVLCSFAFSFLSILVLNSETITASDDFWQYFLNNVEKDSMYG